MKRFIAIAFAFFALAASARNTFTLSSDICSEIRDGNMVRYTQSGTNLTPVVKSDVLAAVAPSNATLNIVAIYRDLINAAVTNVNGVTYLATDIYWTFNFDATGYNPKIRYTYVGAPNFPTWMEAIQTKAVNIGTGEVGGTTYDYLWMGRCWVEQGITPYFQIYVDLDDYNGEPPKDTRTAHFMASVNVSEPGKRLQYVMVDENDNVTPSNVLYTIAKSVTIENELIVARESAVAQSNAFVAAQKVTADLTKAINDNAVTIYQHDYVYSLGETVTISTNTLCRIYRFDAKQGVYNFDGVDYDASDVYYGFTEDIGSLTPEAKFKDSLGGNTIDWELVLADPPVAQSHTFESNGDVYAYCYKMRIYIPCLYKSMFIKIFTEITAQEGDGSALDIVGGIKGGYTGTVTYGNTTVEFVGGLAMAPESAE